MISTRRSEADLAQLRHPLPDPSLAEHQAVLDAIITRDPDTAARAITGPAMTALRQLRAPT